jgi:hypothetical protein
VNSAAYETQPSLNLSNPAYCYYHSETPLISFQNSNWTCWCIWPSSEASEPPTFADPVAPSTDLEAVAAAPTDTEAAAAAPTDIEADAAVAPAEVLAVAAEVGPGKYT